MDSANFNKPLVFGGKAGIGGTISGGVVNSDSLEVDSLQISTILNNIQFIKLQVSNAFSNHLPDTLTNHLSDTTLYFGNYYVSGDLHLKNLFTVLPNEGYYQTIIKVSGNLVIDTVADIQVADMLNLIWIVDGSVIINGSSGLSGCVFVENDFHFEGYQFRPVSIYCGGALFSSGVLVPKAPQSGSPAIPCASFDFPNDLNSRSLIQDGGFENVFRTECGFINQAQHVVSVPGCNPITSDQFVNSCALMADPSTQPTPLPIRFWAPCTNNWAMASSIVWTTGITNTTQTNIPETEFINPFMASTPNPDPTCNHYATASKLLHFNNQPTENSYSLGNGISTALRESLLPGASYILQGDFYVDHDIQTTENIQLLGLAWTFGKTIQYNPNTGEVNGSVNNPDFSAIENFGIGENIHVWNVRLNNPGLPENNSQRWIHFCFQVNVPLDAATCNITNITILPFCVDQNLASFFQNINGRLFIDNLTLHRVGGQQMSTGELCIGQTLVLNNSSLINFAGLPTGGHFIGVGVVENNGIYTFTPQTSGVYEIQYFYNTNLCNNTDLPMLHTLSINVRPDLEFNAGNNQLVCHQTGFVPLAGFSPLGGVWTQISPGGNVLTSQNNQTGVAVNNLTIGTTYTFQYGPNPNNQCGAPATMTFQVLGSHGLVNQVQQCFFPNLPNQVTMQFTGAAHPATTYTWVLPGGLSLVSGSLTGTGFPGVIVVEPTFEIVNSITYTITLQINQPGHSGCNRTYSGTILFIPEDNNVCCLPSNGFIVRSGGYQNPNASNEIERAFLGVPDQVTEIYASNTEPVVFNGVYWIRGTIRLMGKTFDDGSPGEFTIAPGTIFYVDGSPQSSISYPGIVQQNFDFTNSNFLRPSILVAPKVELILNSCTLRGYCSEMWQGIILEDRSSLLSVKTQRQNRPLIRDAFVGISVLGDPTGYYDPLVSINETDFKENIIGVLVSGYSAQNRGGTFAISNSTFNTNPANFLNPFKRVTSPNIYEYYGLAGIAIRGNQAYDSWQFPPEVKLPKTEQFTISNNTFENLLFGISGIGNGLSVDNCGFFNIHKSGITNFDFNLQPVQVFDGLWGNLVYPENGLSVYNCNFRLPGFAADRDQVLNFPILPELATTCLDPNNCTPFDILANQPITGIHLVKTFLNVNSTNNLPATVHSEFRTQNSTSASKPRFGVLVDGFYGMTVGHSEGNRINNISFRNLDYGVRLNYKTGGEQTHEFTHNSFENCLKGIDLEETSQFSDVPTFAIEDNHFRSNGKAIQFTYDNPLSSQNLSYNLQVNRNKFEFCDTATNLKAGPDVISSPVSDVLNLHFRCNDIERSTGTNPQIGIYLGPGTRFKDNKIGGQETTSENLNHPSGNLWPMALGDYTTLPICAGAGADVDDRYNVECSGTSWISPGNWKSIWNNSGETIKYYRFKNEFLGTIESENGDVERPLQTYIVSKTPANGTFTPDAGYTVIEMCTTMLWEDIVFPHSRPAIAGNMPDAIDNNFLGLAFPNPGSLAITIPFQLSAQAKEATIQILDLKGGYVLAEHQVENYQQQSCTLNIEHLPAGLYVYRLCLAGVPMANKQLAVLR